MKKIKLKLPARILLLALFIYNSFAWNDSLAQTGNEWPAFHGSNRSNKSDETGLLRKWPAGGPSPVFTISGLGEGYSSVIIGGGLIYTAGKTDNQTMVFCFDLNGKLVWKKPNGKTWTTTLSWATTYTGSRSTPTYDKGVIYQLGEAGRLTAYDAKTGTEKWSRDIAADFESPGTDYGYAESVLVDGEYIYLRPAGKKGYLICLNKSKGDLVWANTSIPGTEGYSSQIIHESCGYRQIIGSSSSCYYGVDSKSGKLLWKVDFENPRGLNISDAIADKDYVFFSSGYGKGSMLIKLKAEGNGIATEKIWESKLLDNQHGGVILLNGHLYGAGSEARGWFCLDFLTGKQLWNANGKGSLTYADGMLYLLDERGTMKLVRAVFDKFESAGEFKVPQGGTSMYWAHPVVCGGRLYIRHGDKIFVYNVKT